MKSTKHLPHPFAIPWQLLSLSLSVSLYQNKDLSAVAREGRLPSPSHCRTVFLPAFVPSSLHLPPSSTFTSHLQGFFTFSTFSTFSTFTSIFISASLPHSQSLASLPSLPSLSSSLPTFQPSYFPSTFFHPHLLLNFYIPAASLSLSLLLTLLPALYSLGSANKPQSLSTA